MSEGDVSLIRDEDVLRRMWQQTEDFSRKKEIRTHMYKLREERLRNLYSPEPTFGKGGDLTGAQSHVRSLADQSFQSIKSKEVRDAGSPTKEFYRGQELKDLSNTGWNVESENRTTNDGHTHVRAVHANIEGRYDIEGGKGQFAAIDSQKQAVTEYQDENTSLKRNESSLNTAAHEQVFQKTEDGTKLSTSTTKSSSSSKYEQKSTKHETVPYVNIDINTTNFTNKNEESKIRNDSRYEDVKLTNTAKYENSLRESNQGELLSKKVEYPDDNTKVIVETRRLPDGTKVTSTRREFQAPSTHTSRSEQHSHVAKSESNYTSQNTRQTEVVQESEKQTRDIVESQKISDDYDFKKNHTHNRYDATNVRSEHHLNVNKVEDNDVYISKKDNYEHHLNVDKVDKSDFYTSKKDISENFNVEKVDRSDFNISSKDNFDNRSTVYKIDKSDVYFSKKDDNKYKKQTIQRDETSEKSDIKSNEQFANNDGKEFRKKIENDHITDKTVNKNYENVNQGKEKILYVDTRNEKSDFQSKKENKVKSKSVNDEYQTTYQSDYTQKKISNDWSPTHQAWASTLRADSPTKPTRSSSPASSVRSSVSPDKSRKPSSRGGSPSKIDRQSPPRGFSNNYSSSTRSTSETKTLRYTSPDRPTHQRPRSSASPDKRMRDDSRPNISPEKRFYDKYTDNSPVNRDACKRSPSPEKKPHEDEQSPKPSQRSSRGGSPSKIDRQSPPRGFSNNYSSSTRSTSETKTLRYTSPDRPTHQRPRSSASPDKRMRDDSRPNISPEKRFYDKYTDNSPVNRDACKRSPRPEKKPHEDEQSPKPSQSPERRSISSSKTFSNSVTSTNHSRTTMSPSPERKVHPTVGSTATDDQIPGYMKPTASSILSSNTEESTHTHYHSSPDRRSPSKYSPSESPERKIFSQEDHYTLVGEETKRYTRNEDRKKSPSPYEKSPSPSRKSYGYDSRPQTSSTTSTLNRPSSIKDSRSPSPPKGPVSFTDTYDQFDKSESYKSKTLDKQSRNEFTTTTTKRENVSPARGTSPNYKSRPDHPKTSDQEPSFSSRESSPSKYDTYDKKKQFSRKVDEFSTTVTSHEDSKYDTLTTKSTVSSKPARDTTSPSKPANKKYQHTTDFLTTERTSEETNKKHATDQSRQLFTLSSSLTRQPKVDDNAPSTGQSSPTTSVSGFVYYGSPKQEPVTDLDDEEYYSEITKITYQQRPETLDMKLTTTPSKKPCRSPSPGNVVSPTKDKLPRKSSLKKPTVEIEPISPTEKPPSNFCVSPTEDRPIQHKIVKKDRPDKPESVLPKTKAPLERRETYEERCMKILGIIDDKPQNNEPESNSTLPSIYPVRSPSQDSPSKDNVLVNVTKKRNDITTHSTTGKFMKSPVRETSPTKLEDISITIKSDSGKEVTLSKTSKSPPRETSPIKLQDINITIKSDTKKEHAEEYSSLRQSLSPDRKTLDHISKTNKKLDDELLKSNKQPQRNTSPTKKLETPKHSRTPSPIKKVTTVSQDSNDFITTEREQQILEKVQQSLRKLSPDRNERSPSREVSPTKHFSDTKFISEEHKTKLETATKTINEKQDVVKGTINQTQRHNSTDTSKPLSRNVSPTKKPLKVEKSPETPNKHVSSSPKKNVSSPIRSQLPQVVKATAPKPREIVTSHPKPVSPIKTENVVTEAKKTSTTKSNSFSKTISKTNSRSSTSTTKSENIEKRTQVSPKGNKENVSPKKEDTKVTRTASDFSTNKKLSPQRVKSKPEIQVSNLNTTKTATTSVTKSTQKPRDQISKLNIKPKSETTLNMHLDDDDDVIIDDVEHAKSSRENSPDRICPTPVGFLDDVGTPRLPDEVSEPDDEFRKRNHHTIHETESLVDDIVEISEDDELFVKRETDHITASDECLLSVNDKVSKFTEKIHNVSKPKENTSTFKDTEINVHSDFVDERLKSDECLLTVSEKVNKFIKESQDIDDKKISSRKIIDEYDNDTIYQDDYTKLSVNDKAHLFIETAENVKSSKPKQSQKIERADLTDVDESLKSDECLLSVSAKVNKFVKTAEQFLNETRTSEENERKIMEKSQNILKQIIQDDDDIVEQVNEKTINNKDPEKIKEDNDELGTFAKETASSHAKNKDYISPNLKPSEKTTPVKITTLHSSEAVKKAKAMFENIASTAQTTTCKTSTAKLTDIGVIKKSPRTDSTIVHHPSLDEGFPRSDSEMDGPPKTKIPSSGTPTRSLVNPKEKSQTPDRKSPNRHTVEKTMNKSVLRKYPVGQRAEAPKVREPERPKDKVSQPHQTKPSLTKDEPRVEEIEVSTRRGSGKFGVELRRTSVEKSTLLSERRRSSTEHHSPCIEDIFDLDLLEQMLEKVAGYEQRRRIRAQIRLVRKKMESERIDTETYSKTTKITNRSPERLPRTQKTVSPDRSKTKPLLNGHAKEPIEKRPRPYSPEKPTVTKTRSPVRQPSPEKKLRTQSPSKTTVTKPKTNRFEDYASAYMKKVGLSDGDTIKFTKSKTEDETQEFIKRERRESSETRTSSVTKSTSEKQSSRETKHVQVNGHRRSSPEKKRSPERNAHRSSSPEKKCSPERKARTPSDRLYYRSPSPDFKKPKSETVARETTIKTVYDIDKKVKPKTVKEDAPDWVNRNLKKIASETRTSSTKKIETEKSKFRATSPSKVISKPIDVITSSYGIGPLDADGKPLFGIKALRNGANIQVKGTVVREEYHSRNGGEPEGSISVTTYSTQPEDLEKLLKDQSDRPSRIHGLAAITTTKKFGGDTGTTLKESKTKEEQAALERFTHSDRKVDSRIDSSITHKQERMRGAGTQQKRDERSHREEKTERVDRREDKKIVKQSSVKSLTEKYIKSTSETGRSDRTSYPKAGLILRTTNLKDTDTGLRRSGSDHSLGSTEENVTTTTKTTEEGGRRTTTTTTTRSGSSRSQERSFLDSTTKVSGVQDILTRMKNADIVIEDGDTNEDAEARALLNKFLGATVLMAGMQGYVQDTPTGKLTIKQETVRSSSGGGSKVTRSVQEVDLDQCWDERVLRKLLEECTDYEQRRRIRGRIRTLMAEQEACASAVSEAVAGLGDGSPTGSPTDEREEAEVTVTASARRDSSEKKTTTTTTTVKSSKVIENVRAAPKPVSPFTKFRQLEKQNSTNSPSSPGTPTSPGPYFKFTDPALQASAATIKERLLQWCRDKTRDYENVKLENFSTSWADGLAFCALVHHFLPNTFDYSKLTPEKRRHNFTLAFKVADEKAGIYPLLDVDDMVAMRKPDWKCVFTYVQAIHRRFKDEP